jgi:hypothetical protein
VIADTNGAAQQRQGARFTRRSSGAALRAGRTHRNLSELSADSAAGIVPSKEFLAKFLPDPLSARVLK